MISHCKYLSYVVRHKWFVFCEGLRVGAPIWRLLIHDWTKFLPSEWIPYTRFFYGDFPSTTEVHGDMRLVYRGPYKEQVASDFDVAWVRHQNRNPHHWQYWVLVNDSSEPKYLPLDMPEKFIREMVADWAGAGLAITGKADVATWYEKNRDQILLSDWTRQKVEMLLRTYYPPSSAITAATGQ